MGPTVRMRSRATQTMGALMVLAAVLGLGSALVDGTDTLLQYAGPLVLFGLLGWAAFWQPYVEVSDGGVVVANTLRTVEVPWPAVESVEGRYGLRLVTAYGSVNAWAGQAPAGRQRARGEEGVTARAVSERLDALREAGHLDDARLERPRLRTVWHRPLITAMVALVVASAVLPLLA